MLAGGGGGRGGGGGGGGGGRGAGRGGGGLIYRIQFVTLGCQLMQHVEPS